MTVRQIIRYNLRGLLNFSGRDPRRVFWVYVGIIFSLTMVLFNIATIPIFVRMAAEMKAAVTGPTQMANPAEPISYPGFAFFWVTAVFSTLIIVLAAAAVTRRLHDLGRSGKWAFTPALLLLLSLCGFAQFYSSERAAVSVLLLLLGIMIYQLSLLVLILFLCLPSSPQENRFGKPANSAVPQRT